MTPTATLSTPAETLRAAARGGPGALVDLLPVAIGATVAPGVDPTDPGTWGARPIALSTVVNPLFAAVLDAVGATRRGRRTWSLSLASKADHRPIAAVLDALRPGYLIAASSALPESNTDRSLYFEYGDAARWSKIRDLLATTGTGERALAATTVDHAVTLSGHLAAEADGLAPAAGVVVRVAGGTLWLRVVCRALRAEDWEEHEQLRQLDLSGPTHPLAPRLRPALDSLAWLEHGGFEVHDLEGRGRLDALRRRARRAVLVDATPGRPALADVALGPDLAEELGAGPLVPRATPAFAVEAARTTDEVVERVGSVIAPGDPVRIDDEVLDVAAMSEAAAAPAPLAGLRPYQAEAAAAYLATNAGMVNASAPGTGKTVMTLGAWAVKAAEATAAGRGWQGLVVVPAALRLQWAAECGRFIPAAEVAVLRTGAEVAAFCDAEAGEGDDGSEFADAPLLAAFAGTPRPDAREGARVVITSYDLAARHAGRLAALGWDDLCVDEAAVLRNPNTKRSQGLWELRRAAGVGLALTGTPIDRSVDDLGQLLAWSRGRGDLLGGQRLSNLFWRLAGDEDQRASFARAMGPLLFRRDRSEIADDLPAVSTEVVLLEPNAAERDLAEAARRQLRGIYDDLVAQIERRRELDPGDPALAGVAEGLASARGAMLGGVTLARMAASDPEALLASESAGAALLDSAGLIDAAVRAGCTKRTQIAGLVAELVDAGEAVLVFSDFTRAVRLLADTLTSAGVAAGIIVGGQSGTARNEAVEAFQRGDLDVLVCSSAGNEGLNLQRASVLVHYDLPWSPSAVIQRVGRAARLGSTNPHLSVLVPIMAGTIEERVASVLVPRAAEALAALDTTRGKSAADTEIGVALGGLVDVVNPDEVGDGMLEMARAILGDD